MRNFISSISTNNGTLIEINCLDEFKMKFDDENETYRNFSKSEKDILEEKTWLDIRSTGFNNNVNFHF